MSLDNLTDEELALATIALMQECPGGICHLEWAPSLDALMADVPSINARHSLFQDLAKIESK